MFRKGDVVCLKEFFFSDKGDIAHRYTCTFYDEATDDLFIQGFNGRLKGKDFIIDIKETRKNKIKRCLK